MADFEVIGGFLRHVRIAHDIPGRIRFKLLDVALTDEGRALLAQARQFEHALDGIPGVKSIQVNLLARSCTIEYDKSTIPQVVWQDLLNGKNSPSAESLLRVLRARYLELKPV